jgi:hypothetical protein
VQSANFVDAQGDVTATARLSITPIMLGLFTSGNLSASADIAGVRLGKKLEIALVLDNTYSMVQFNDRLGLTKIAAPTSSTS